MIQPQAVRLTPLLLTAAVLALAGCGESKGAGSSTSSASYPPATSTTQPASTSSTASTSTSAPAPSSGAGGAVSLASNSEGQLAYDTKSLTAKAGKVTIDFTNDAPLSHNVTIESSAGKVLGATPTFSGGSKTLTLDLQPGTYKFFCSVPGHRMAGMEGALVVN